MVELHVYRSPSILSVTYLVKWVSKNEQNAGKIGAFSIKIAKVLRYPLYCNSYTIYVQPL